MLEEKNIKFYSEIASKKVDWLWYPYIPYGKITIIQGDPGEGKTTFALYLASLQANGGNLPFTNQELTPAKVVYQNTEDGLADTIKPRLERNGANCNNICFIDEEIKSLDLLDERIEKTIKENDVKLFILDPIQAFLGASNITLASDIRPLMRRIAKIAETYNCAIVMVGHQNKKDSGKDIYRALGSIDIVAAARSVISISCDSQLCRCLTHIKSNLAPCGKQLYFSVDEKGINCWKDTPFIYKSRNDSISFINKLERDILKILKKNDISVNELNHHFSTLGISERSVIRARRNIGATAYKKGNAWYVTIKQGDTTDNE